MARSPERQAEIKAMDLIERLMARTEAKVLELADGLPSAAARRVSAWFADEYDLLWLDKAAAEGVPGAPDWTPEGQAVADAAARLATPGTPAAAGAGKRTGSDHPR